MSSNKGKGVDEGPPKRRVIMDPFLPDSDSEDEEKKPTAQDDPFHGSGGRVVPIFQQSPSNYAMTNEGGEDMERRGRSSEMPSIDSVLGTSPNPVTPTRRRRNSNATSPFVPMHVSRRALGNTSFHQAKYSSRRPSAGSPPPPILREHPLTHRSVSLPNPFISPRAPRSSSAAYETSSGQAGPSSASQGSNANRTPSRPPVTPRRRGHSRTKSKEELSAGAKAWRKIRDAKPRYPQ